MATPSPAVSSDNAHLVKEARDVLDEINTLHACLAAVGDLLIPEKELNVVSRDNLATLFGYLAQRLEETSSELTRSLCYLYLNVGEPT